MYIMYIGACICAHAQCKCVGMCADIHAEASGQPQKLSCRNHPPCLETQSLAGLDLAEHARMPSSEPGDPLSPLQCRDDKHSQHIYFFCYMGSKVPWVEGELLFYT